jgi:hypothetical protein
MEIAIYARCQRMQQSLHLGLMVNLVFVFPEFEGWEIR